MTEQEVLQQQEENGNSAFYLILIGTFLHAYGNGAFALARATGYHVLCRRRKAGRIITAGFPISRLDNVRSRILAAGGMIDALPDGKTWLFSGFDGTPDDAMVVLPRSVISARSLDKGDSGAAAPPPAAPAADNAPAVRLVAGSAEWLTEMVLGFKLATSTPLQAMLFLGDLQQQLKNGTE